MSAVSPHTVARKVNRIGVMVVTALLASAIAFSIVEFARPSAHASAINGKGMIEAPPLPTVTRPLAPPATQMTLAAATAAFGSSVVLPDTSAVGGSGAGPVWEATKGSTSTVAVTYPAQGVIIGYVRPAVYSDPATGYQQLSEGIASSQVVDLNGTTPALVIPQNSDETGASFGVVAFETNGTEVRVMGHSDTPTLEAIAQSILARSTSAP